MRIFAFMALVAAAASSFAVTIDFEDRTSGDIIGSQYAAQGVTFVSGVDTSITGLTYDPSGLQQWATNTGLTVTTVTGDVAGSVGAPLAGNIVRTFSNYMNEDGDPVFTLKFSGPVTSVSLDFGNVLDMDSTRLLAVDSTNTVVATASATTTGSQTISLSGLNGVSEVVVTPGDDYNYVPVDNLNFTLATVPEPGTFAFAGLGVLALLRRRKSA